MSPRTATEKPPRAPYAQGAARRRRASGCSRPPSGSSCGEDFAGSSVEKISAEAGFTRGAFYSNFESKEQLFVELLQDRIYSGYRRDARAKPDDRGHAAGAAAVGVEVVRDVQGTSEGRWLFQLWLECLTQAARDEEFRKLAATFWSGNRALIAAQDARPIQGAGARATAFARPDCAGDDRPRHRARGPAPGRSRGGPLDLYVPLYDALFGRLVDEEVG